MEITFTTKNKKQLEASKYWIDDTTQQILFGGAKSGGKDQPLTAKVLTPFGWSTMGEMKVGSVILNPIGEQQTVIAIHPQGMKDVYRIIFSDGSSTECGREHLWQIRKIQKKRKTLTDWRVQTTEQVKALLEKKWTKIAIPTTIPLNFSKSYRTNQIKIKPYTLGVLIGDGCLRGSSLNFTTDDVDIVNGVKKDGYKLNKTTENQFSIIQTDIRNILRKWGLYQKKSEQKFIPEYYKWASLDVRKELLAGLMDTDGTVDRLKGNASYTTTSKQLANDVCFLVNSLGGIASITEKQPFYYGKNKTKINGQIAFNIWISVPFNPFKLKRKQKLYKIKTKERTIKSIEYVGKKPTQCITVDNPNSLYITDDFIVTHNSYLGAVLIFGDALIYPGTHYFIARKDLTDLRKHTIPTVYEVFKNWGLKHEDYLSFNGQDNLFNLKNGSKVYLIACKEEPSDPLFERFGSMQMTKGWIEEGGEVNENAKANLWLSVGRWKNEEYGLKKKLLITCNPKKGWMKREFIDLWQKGELPPEKKFVASFATDNPYISDEYRKSLSEDNNKVRRQRLWEGKWDYDENADSLISEEALTDAFSNTINKDGKKYLTVDIARLGRDKTVLSFWEGLELYKIETYQKLDIEQSKQIIKDKLAMEKIPYSNVLIDEDGVGGGVVDGLFGVKGFVAQSTPIPTASQIREKANRITGFLNTKPGFRNLKAQCAYKLAELINERKIAFKVEQREQVIEELSSLLRAKDIDSENKLQIIPKDDVKKELGRSPDIGDTLIYRAYFEILNDTQVFGGNEQVYAVQLNKFAQNKSNIGKSSTK